MSPSSLVASLQEKIEGHMKNPKEISIPELLQKAETAQANPEIYANHVQVNINLTDLTLDFFRIQSMPGHVDRVKAVFLQRVVLPINMGKGLTSALANLIKSFEKDTGITLLDTRGQMEGDEVNLWTQVS